MSDRERGTLKAVLNCLAEQRKHDSRRTTSVAVMVQDRCAFRKGDYVVVRDFDGKECTVEHAMTPDEIDFQKSSGSLLTTVATCIGFPCDYLRVDREVTELADRLATLEAENARLSAQLESICGALSDAGTVLAARTDGDYAESVRDLTRERDRLAALVERLAKWLPDPKAMSGYDDPNAPEAAKRGIEEAAALLAAISENRNPNAEHRPGETKE